MGKGRCPLTNEIKRLRLTFDAFKLDEAPTGSPSSIILQDKLAGLEHGVQVKYLRTPFMSETWLLPRYSYWMRCLMAGSKVAKTLYVSF